MAGALQKARGRHANHSGANDAHKTKGVNVGLLPAKGITLPFVSSGGSSMLAVSITLGMLLALTRHRPSVARLRKPPLLTDVAGLQATGPVHK